MRVPAFRSDHYRALGWKPVYWGGVVLWLTPQQYDKVKVLDVDGKLADATEGQIERQDRWHDEAMAEERRESAWLARLARSLR